jgi:ABC-type multidrug transport system fused ATPase/permease subunit
MALEPYFWKLFIDQIENIIKDTNSNTWIIVAVLLWIWASLMIMGSRFFYGYVLLNSNIADWSRCMIDDLRAMIHLPPQYHLTVQNGEKMKLLDRWSEAVWEVGDLLILEIIPYSLLTIGLAVLWYTISPILTLITLGFLPIVFFIASYFGKIAYTNQKIASSSWDKYFWRINDSFVNINLIKLFAREKNEESIILDLYRDASEKQNRMRSYWLRFTSFGRIIRIIPKIASLIAWIYLYKEWSVSLGTVFFFYGFSETLYWPVYIIFQNYQQLSQSLAKYEDLQETIQQDKEIDTWKNILPWVQENIEFKNVSFSYPSNDREVLSDVSLNIKKGERIALMGHTGSGKSTIIQLLMRFYAPSSGSIEIDGTNIYDSTLESYRQKFAAVFQDTTLFNETIRHNLEYVRDGLTLEDLRSACQKANILEFIESLSAWWETEVGERGLKLSWGEKQRIAIARAILANPEILILDEATSALDTKTERLVQEAFDHLMEWRTSIIIAHRLSTIMNADRIYILEKGRIIDSGTHQELYVSSSVYREMVDLQHDGFVGEEI